MINNLKKDIIIIGKNIKKNFTSKDRNIIIKTIGKILYAIFVVIILKVPFIFLKTLLLDLLNNNGINYTIQNLISVCFEFAYIIVVIIYVYKKFKKYFGND